MRELDAPAPSPAALLGLQRSLGNQAVTQLVRSRATTAGSASRTPALQRIGETGERGRRPPWEQILANLLTTLPPWLAGIVQRVAAAMRSGDLQVTESAVMAALPILSALARLGGGADGGSAIVPHRPGGGGGTSGGDGIGAGPWHSVVALLGTLLGTDLQPILGFDDVLLNGDALAEAGLVHLVPGGGALPAPPMRAPAPLGLPAPPPPLGVASPARSQFARGFPRREQLAADVFDAASGNQTVALAAMTILVLDPPADQGELVTVVGLVARIADPMAAIQAIMAERPALTPEQRRVAITIAGRPADRNGGPEALDSYLQSTRRPPAQPGPTAHPLAGWAGPSGHVVDDRHPINRALGIDGEHELLRAHLDPLNRPYGVAELTQPCLDMVAAGANAPTVSTLLRSLATHQPTLPRLNQASASVVAMLRHPAFAPHANTTLTAHPALLGANGMAECITLIARRPGNATQAVMVSLLEAVQPLSQPHRVVMLRRGEQLGPGGVAPPAPVFAPELTAAALNDRIGSLTALAPGGPALTIQQVHTEFSSLENSVNALVLNGTCSAGSAQTLREMFQLVSTRWAALQAFINNQAVRAGLNQPGVRNSANWLRWFVTGYQGAPASPAPGVTHADPTGRQVVITDWIVNHVRERHTFENFDFSDTNIDRAPNSTFFAAGISDAQIVGDLRNIINLCGGQPFNGNPINIGQYQVRIARVPGLGAVRYRFTQFYMGIAIGYAQIPAAVLKLIRTIMAL